MDLGFHLVIVAYNEIGDEGCMHLSKMKWPKL